MRRVFAALAWACLVSLAQGCLLLADPDLMCEQDKDCTGSDTCRLGKCVAKGTCETESQCRYDEVCAKDRCVSVDELECTADDDCAPYACDPAAHECFEECTSTLYCSDGNVCVDGECVKAQCQSATGCGSFACVNGFCLDSCANDTECAPGYFCGDGACYVAGAGLCFDDGDCNGLTCCDLGEASSCAIECPVSRPLCADAACADGTECLPSPFDLGDRCLDTCGDSTDCRLSERCVPAPCPDASCPHVCWPVCDADQNGDVTCGFALGDTFECGTLTTSSGDPVDMCIPTCKDNADCPVGECASGHCTLLKNGAECETYAECESQDCSGDHCVGAADWGDPCATDYDCLSQLCEDEACTERLFTGETCTGDSQCMSDQCCPIGDGTSECSDAAECPGALGAPCYDSDACIEFCLDEFSDGFCTHDCTSDADCVSDGGYDGLCTYDPDNIQRCYPKCVTTAECEGRYGTGFTCAPNDSFDPTGDVCWPP